MFDFEDLNKHNHNRRKSGYNRYHDDEHDSHYRENNHHGDYRLLYFLEKLKQNKKLRWVFILFILLIIGIVIVAIILLLPLIGDLLDYISQNGLKGIVDKIWQGSGK